MVSMKSDVIVGVWKYSNQREWMKKFNCFILSSPFIKLIFIGMSHRREEI